jgi:hypothetical protein
MEIETWHGRVPTETYHDLVLSGAYIHLRLKQKAHGLNSRFESYIVSTE